MVAELGERGFSVLGAIGMVIPGGSRTSIWASGIPDGGYKLTATGVSRLKLARSDRTDHSGRTAGTPLAV